MTSEGAETCCNQRFVRELATEVTRRLRQEGLKAGSLSLKVMVRHPEAPIDTPKLLGHGWVDTHTKNSALREEGRQRSAVDDPALIAKTAWNLMKSLNAPPHELRGIGITLQKLEKDGQSVDVAREKGQSKLSFAAAPPKVARSRSRSSESADPSREASPRIPIGVPPAEGHSSTSTTPEVIVLDDSDSDADATVVANPRTEVKRSIAAPERSRSAKPRAAKEVYIPQQLFSTKSRLAGPPSASQVSDDELAHYGIDPGVFHSLGPELQREELAYHRKHKLRYIPKRDKQKPAVPIKRPDPKIPAPVPSVLVLSPSSPADGELGKAGALLQNFPGYKDLPPEVLRDILPALGPATQRNVLNMYKLRVAGNGSSTRDDSTTRNVVDVRIRAEPQFSKMTDIDDIENRLEHWVTAGRDLLNEADLDRLGAYLERCVSRDKGHNLSKAVDLLKYWKILLEDEFGRKDATGHWSSGRAWWEGFERTFQRVDYLVWKDTACHLKL